jgi:hypothetical protein
MAQSTVDTALFRRCETAAAAADIVYNDHLRRPARQQHAAYR